MTDGSNRQTQRFQDVDFNINKKQMGVLLATAAKSGSRDVRELAKTIVKDGVDKVTSAHSGGHGGGGREADPTQHCTVRAGRNNYHVYLKNQRGKWLITKITG